MACLIDTGILLRAFDAPAPEYRSVRQSLATLWARQEQLVVAVQNLVEFWNVSTRPVDRNGYGLSVGRTSGRLALIERVCEVVNEDVESYRIWRGLLTTYSVTGVSVHDARLVSVMLARGISTILTLNARDFSRYAGISAVTPEKG